MKLPESDSWETQSTLYGGFVKRQLVTFSPRSIRQITGAATLPSGKTKEGFSLPGEEDNKEEAPTLPGR